MSSRDTILQHVRKELGNGPGKGPAVSLPAVPEIWPRENPAPAAMAERFAAELARVDGEVIRCAAIEDARRRLVALVEQTKWTSLGAMDGTLVREVTAKLPSDLVAWSAADWQPRRMAELSASIIEADALLADTGSCLIACPSIPERLLCYLPPACVVIARLDRLFEHLPAAWATIAARASDPAVRGEFVIVTGPSRTSDIEKTLILGVHGPKRLVVILVERGEGDIADIDRLGKK